jgi:hypothetical protein
MAASPFLHMKPAGLSLSWAPTAAAEQGSMGVKVVRTPWELAAGHCLSYGKLIVAFTMSRGKCLQSLL